MKRGWQGIKANHSLNEMKAINVVNNMVVSSSTQSLVVIGQFIGVNQKILNKDRVGKYDLRMVLACNGLVQLEQNGKNVLTNDVVDVAVEFWKNETRVNLNKKDIMKHRIMKNIWEEHAIDFLEEP